MAPDAGWAPDPGPNDVFILNHEAPEAREHERQCEDVAVAQFWVRNAASHGECYWGEKN